VNVIYCGLNGTNINSYINSFIQIYNSNDSGHASSPTIRHNYYDVQTIYNYVGANKALVDSMNSSNTVEGAVYRNGDVIVNNKVIATNARVAARFSVPGAVSIPGTNAYLRTTTSSFAYNSEPAIIRLDGNGNMLFAAIIGCGNAVKATPVPKPNYTINKLVAGAGSNYFVKYMDVKPGNHVVYKIVVTSTGNAPVTNLVVKDALPANVSYIAGTLKRDNTPVSTSFFSTGVNIGTLRNGTSTTFTFEAIAAPKDTPESCKPELLNNVSSMTATSLPGESSNAELNKSCAAKPVYACTILTPTEVDRTTFNFTAKAVAENGAVIDSYNFSFGDGATKTVTTNAATASAEHSYANAGTYQAKVSVTFTVPGLNGPQTVTSPYCETPVTVQPAPTAECTDLKLIQDTSNPRAISAKVTYVTSNGASFSSVSFDWGDGTKSAPSTQTTADHTFDQDGSYDVVATLEFNSGSSSLPASTCKAPITITTVMPTCDNLTISTNNEEKSVTITDFTYTANNGSYDSTVVNWGDSSTTAPLQSVINQTHTYSSDGPFTIVATPSFKVNGKLVPATSDACQQTVSFTETPTPPVTPPVTPPTELVNTGAGNIFGLFAITSILGAIGYRFFIARRLSRNQ